jgi:hypothetical protein
MSESPTDKTTSPLIHLTEPAPASKPAAAVPKAAPSARELADMTPQARFEHQQQEGDRVLGTSRPAFKPGTEKISAEDYERLTYSERIAYAAAHNRPAETNPDGSADPAAPPVAELTGPRIKVGDAEFAEAEVLAALADIAARDANLLSLPAKPADYKLELPADFKAPEGVTFKFNDKDPIRGPVLTSAREFALANHLTQEQFSGMLGLYAGSIAHESKMISDGAKAEREKMGTAGTARIDAVTRFWKAQVGDEIARAIMQLTVTERQVRGYEIMIQKFTSQGSGRFRTTGREAPEPDGRLPSGPEGDKIWDGMSYGDKKAYSEKFSQRGT